MPRHDGPVNVNHRRLATVKTTPGFKFCHGLCFGRLDTASCTGGIGKAGQERGRSIKRVGVVKLQDERT